MNSANCFAMEEKIEADTTDSRTTLLRKIVERRSRSGSRCCDCAWEHRPCCCKVMEQNEINIYRIIEFQQYLREHPDSSKGYAQVQKFAQHFYNYLITEDPYTSIHEACCFSWVNENLIQIQPIPIAKPDLDLVAAAITPSVDIAEEVSESEKIKLCSSPNKNKYGNLEVRERKDKENDENTGLRPRSSLKPKEFTDFILDVNIKTKVNGILKSPKRSPKKKVEELSESPGSEKVNIAEIEYSNEKDKIVVVSPKRIIQTRETKQQNSNSKFGNQKISKSPDPTVKSLAGTFEDTKTSFEKCIKKAAVKLEPETSSINNSTSETTGESLFENLENRKLRRKLKTVKKAPITTVSVQNLEHNRFTLLQSLETLPNKKMSKFSQESKLKMRPCFVYLERLKFPLEPLNGVGDASTKMLEASKGSRVELPPCYVVLKRLELTLEQLNIVQLIADLIGIGSPTSTQPPPPETYNPYRKARIKIVSLAELLEHWHMEGPFPYHELGLNDEDLPGIIKVMNELGPNQYARDKWYEITKIQGLAEDEEEEDVEVD